MNYFAHEGHHHFVENMNHAANAWIMVGVPILVVIAVAGFFVVYDMQKARRSKSRK